MIGIQGAGAVVRFGVDFVDATDYSAPLGVKGTVTTRGGTVHQWVATRKLCDAIGIERVACAVAWEAAGGKGKARSMAPHTFQAVNL